MIVRSLAVAWGAVLFSVAPATGLTAEVHGQWVTAWATALQPIPQRAELPPLYRAPEVAGRTVRQIVYPTLSGNAVRIHVSNAYGKTPLVIEDMSLARSTAGAKTQSGSEIRVTFGGRTAVTVPAGGEMDSDAVRADLVAGAAYAVSTYMGPDQRMVAWHRVSSRVNYVSTPGNHAHDADDGAYRQRFTQYAWITGLTVEASSASTVAAVGDSITDGLRSSLNQNRRWPDALARRLAGAGDRVDCCHQSRDQR